MQEKDTYYVLWKAFNECKKIEDLSDICMDLMKVITILQANNISVDDKMNDSLNMIAKYIDSFNNTTLKKDKTNYKLNIKREMLKLDSYLNKKGLKI